MIYCEVLSVTWPNFTIVKYNSKISIIYHQIKISKRYNEQVFNKKAVLKNFAIFTEKHLRWSLFLNKNAGLQSWNFIKKRLQHRFFPVNIAKFLRAPVLENICEWLFKPFPTWASNITSNMGIEENIFSKTKKQKKKKNIQNLARWKNLPFHDALDHFVFLYISIFSIYIIKDDRNEEL